MITPSGGHPLVGSYYRGEYELGDYVIRCHWRGEPVELYHWSLTRVVSPGQQVKFQELAEVRIDDFGHGEHCVQGRAGHLYLPPIRVNLPKTGATDHAFTLDTLLFLQAAWRPDSKVGLSYAEWLAKRRDEVFGRY